MKPRFLKGNMSGNASRLFMLGRTKGERRYTNAEDFTASMYSDVRRSAAACTLMRVV